ncbi:MAG: hypothetical protein COU90_03760 [Candidatus Ryanbacteria bacterium CG10_big_fil_rev_8_21_14_0_10_43_42]|uniref:NYN domain-containing protein n=1 Tax=Candidatus Ryanbacteria bacterium CG10_big_fil_rev_8_21_14_0_10_43_42 TaxID=1974864 RepID=A0A2M8KWA2_9BACT|nr:MAG: hypothetical protein COU90_03760 [Candidatus Ryanbacteria bacterium CG10_big_fil_rev_8_21_14_0_10_43_42]
MTRPLYPAERVAVFIDVQNMYHSARSLHNARVNFKEILKEAVANRHLIRAFAYVIRTKTGEEQPFFEALQKQGIEIRVRDLLEFYGGAKKADWDVGIVIDAIRTSEIVDAIVLVSGDGDFVDLIDHLRSRGRHIEVMAFGKSTSSRLKEAADTFIDISEEPKKYLINIKKGSSKP